MYLFLDTETTGVRPTDRTVSICWAVYNGVETQLQNVYHVIRPEGFSIPPGATAIHGITTEHARRAGVALADVLTLLHGSIRDHKPALYIGHNVAFDRPIVLSEYRRSGLVENLSSLRTYCTMKSTTHVCQLPGRYGYKWPSLGELHRHLFQQPHASAHSAEGDVAACARCFFELKRRGHVR